MSHTPEETEDYRFYVGGSQNALDENTGIKEATRNAQEQAIRANFGITTNINLLTYELMDTATLAKRTYEISDDVRLREFERLDSHWESDTNGRTNLWLLFSYRKSAIEEEKQRLSEINKKYNGGLSKREVSSRADNLELLLLSELLFRHKKKNVVEEVKKEPEPQKTSQRIKVENLRQCTFFLGARLGASGATIKREPNAAFAYVLLFGELRLGPFGLRLGWETNSTGSGNVHHDTHRMKGFQGVLALPIYVFDSTKHSLMFYPIARILTHKYTFIFNYLTDNGSHRKVDQVGFGGGMEYRYMVSKNTLPIAVSLNIEWTRYGNDNSAKGKQPLNGSIGVVFGF